MATELNLEQKLADLLDTRNFHPEMLGKDGRPADTEDAKTFSFDYVSGSGKNYGTMVVILGNDNEMYIMYGDNLGKTIEDPEDREEFFNFQQQLTDLANRNRWTSTLTDLSKLRRVQAGIAAIKEGLFEGYYGTRKISYTGEPTEARLMIKHNRTLGENDARFRYVESIFIETADGERFKLPFTHMTGARAMLEHVRQGGKPYDIRGNHICEMVTELKVLSRFNRAAGNRVMEGVTQEIVEQAQHYYNQLRESLKHLSSNRGYTAYFESWHPLDVQEQESLVEDIKTMFIEQTLDTRIEAALPLLARIQQQGNNMKEADIFESWANRLVEGTWSLPETPEQLSKLKELMGKELIVGPDATNATEQLYDLVGDDELFDRLSELAQRDPRANIWNDTEVMDRLRELGVETEGIAPAGAEGDTAAEVPAEAPAEQPVQGVAEDFDRIIKLAGVPVTEARILDESGETLEHILDRFKFEVRQFEQDGELDNDLYEALFDYYFNAGEMPYGTAKARTGDPYEWVSQRLYDDLGLSEGSNMATFEGDTEDAIAAFLNRGGEIQRGKYHSPRKSEKTDYGSKHIGGMRDAVAGKAGKTLGRAAATNFMGGGKAVVGEESGCNHTMEGEYCPEHGLMECGVMESIGGTVAGSVAPVIDEQGIAEGPFTGIGKMMMKHKLKKGMKKDSEAEDDAFDRMHDYDFADPERFGHEDDFSNAFDAKRRKERALDRLSREGVAEDSMPYPHGKPEAGDKITWYHSSNHPEIEGTVVGWKDGHLIVSSVDPSPRNTEKTVAKYRVPKNNILSVEKQGVAEATGNPGMPHDFTAVQPGVEVWYKGRFAGWTTGKVYDDPYGKSGKMVAFEPNPSEFPGDEGRVLALPYDEVSLRKSTSIGKLKGPGQGVAEDHSSLEEGLSHNVVVAFAILGGILLGGHNAYVSHKNQQRWMQAYEQIKQTDPATAEKIRELVQKYKTQPVKFGPDNLSAYKIEKIISDFENQKIKEQGVAEGQDDPMNYNAAITSSYYESADPLARIKELALRK